MVISNSENAFFFTESKGCKQRKAWFQTQTKFGGKKQSRKRGGEGEGEGNKRVMMALYRSTG